MKSFFYLFLLVFFVSCGSKGLKVEENKATEAVETLPSQVVENKEEIKTDKYFFAFDSSKFSSTEKNNLKAFIDKVKSMKNKIKGFVLTGNCDERGSDKYNDKLGLERAKSVQVELLKLFSKKENKDLKKAKISVKSNGKRKPVISNAQNESEHAQNRYVLIELK